MKYFLKVTALTIFLICAMNLVNVNAVSKQPERRVFIGDSRFVGMSYVKKGSKDVYIAKKSMGLTWFKEQESEFRFYDSKNTVFIIGFGVNDLNNVFNYVDYVNNLGLKGKVYFCQVNPVVESNAGEFGYTVTNSRIDNFNSVLKRYAKNYIVLNTNKRLVKVGYNARDGLHYDSDTYKKLYRYIKNHALL